MAKVIKTIIQVRRDTEANWLLNKDIIPASGEPCLTLDGAYAGQIKFGDGKKTWEQLPYVGVASLSGDGKTIVVKDGVASLFGADTATAGQSVRIADNGSLEWYSPAESKEVVEIKESVTSLQEIVNGQTEVVETVKTEVVTLQEIINAQTEVVETVKSEVVTLQEVVAKKANADEVYTKSEIDGMISGAFHYRGTVATMDELNALTDMKQGDVYQVESEGDFKVYDGDSWEYFCTGMDLSGYATVEQHNTLQEIVNGIQSNYLTEEKAKAIFDGVKYEISSKPVGTLVDYREKEIRVMCPASTEWKQQAVGPTGDASKYYIGFKAYAPDGAVSFKEDLAEVINDQTMFYFEGNDFAGTDKFGRKYSICWLAVAYLENGAWHYYGDLSSKSKYIGFYYTVEWYDVDGVVIGTDTIRINLTNEECHNAIQPFYMGSVIEGVQLNGVSVEAVNKVVNIPVASEETYGVVKSTDVDNGIAINEDGTMEVVSVSFNKLVQDEGDEFILDGGGASV